MPLFENGKTMKFKILLKLNTLLTYIERIIGKN